MAECQGCHYRFPKPEMKKVLTSVGGGYTPPRTTTKLNKSWQPIGYSQSQGTYRRGREKTLWFCPECYETRKAGQMRGGLYVVLVVLGLLVASVIFSGDKRERSSAASANQAEVEPAVAVGSQTQDADNLPEGQADETSVGLEEEGSLPGGETAAELDQVAAADTSTGDDVSAIATMKAPGGATTSNVIALREAVAAAVTTRQSQTWSHYNESGSVVVVGIDPKSQCPIMYFTVNEVSWRSIAVPVCPGQRIVD
jgi:hypothetical protein